jgi:hypothetical protein
MSYNSLQKGMLKISSPKIVIRTRGDGWSVGVQLDVDMKIKKKFKGNPTTGWLFSPGTNNKTYLKVFAITDSEILQKLQNLDTVDITKVLMANEKKANVQNMMPPRFTTGDVLKLRQVTDKKGNTIYKIPFSLETPFDVENENGGNLTLFMVPVVENSEGNFSFSSCYIKKILSGGTTIRKVARYSLPEDAESHTTSDNGHAHYYYVDSYGNGKTYELYKSAKNPANYTYEQIHVHSIVGGQIQTATGKVGPHKHATINLNKKMVNNTGIVDLRNIAPTAKQCVEDITADTVEIAASDIQAQNTIISTAPKLPGPSPQHNVFSDLFISKNSNNVNSLILSLNMANVAKQSSGYEGICISKPLQDKIIASTKIQSLRLYRQQYLNPDTKAPLDFDISNTEQILVVQSSDQDGKIIPSQEKNYLEGDLNETIGSISEPSLRGSSNVLNVRQLVVADYGAAKLAGGLFVYHVEMEATDALSQLLKDFIEELKTVNNDVEDLFQASTNVNSKGIPTFNELSQKFIPSFVSNYHTSGLNTLFKNHVAKYLEIRSYFQEVGELSLMDVYYLLNPQISTPSTISEFLALNQELLSSISQLLGAYTSGKRKINGGFVGGVQQPAVTFGANADKNIIRIQKKFWNNVFSRQTSEYSGQGYVVMKSDTQLEELPVLTRGALGERIRQEGQRAGLDLTSPGSSVKTVQILGQTIPVTNNGYLTPIAALVNQAEYDIGSSQSSEILSMNIDISRLHRNVEARKSFTNDAETSLKNELDDWSTPYSISVTNNILMELAQEELEGILDNTQTYEGNDLDTGDIEKINHQQEQEEGLKKPTIDILSRIYDSVHETNISNKDNEFLKNLPKLDTGDLSQLPYHVLLLFQRAQNTNLSFSDYYQQYMNLFQVEAFSGFSTTSDGTVVISEPVFTQVSNAATLSNGTLCRLMPYNNAYIDFKHEPDLHLPLLNQYFIVEGS